MTTNEKPEKIFVPTKDFYIAILKRKYKRRGLWRKLCESAMTRELMSKSLGELEQINRELK